MTKPITPAEAEAQRVTVIPDEVLEAFNQMIIKNLEGDRSSFKLREVADLAASNMQCQHKYLYDNKWLNVESVYRRAGWKVKFDSPSIGDNYDAYFVFTKRNDGHPND